MRSADSMMDSEPNLRPRRLGFFSNAGQNAYREGFVGLVLEKPDASPLVVIAHKPRKPHDRAIAGRSPHDCIREREQVQGFAAHGH